MTSSQPTSAPTPIRGGYWKRKFDAMDARFQESGTFQQTRKWVCQESLKDIFKSDLTWDNRAPASQVTVGRGYKRLIDMFNGARDLIDANDRREELLEDSANLDDENMFDCEWVTSLLLAYTCLLLCY